MGVAQGHTVDGESLAAGQVAQHGLRGCGGAQTVVDLAHAHIQGAGAHGSRVHVAGISRQAGQGVVAGQAAVAAIDQGQAAHVVVGRGHVTVAELGVAKAQGLSTVEIAQGQLGARQAGGTVVGLVRAQGQGARCDGELAADGDQLVRRVGVGGVGQGVRRGDGAGDAVGAHIHTRAVEREVHGLAAVAGQIPVEFAGALAQALFAVVGGVVVTHLRHVVIGGIAIDRRGRAHAHDQGVGVDDVEVARRHIGCRQGVVAVGQADGAGQHAGVAAQAVLAGVGARDVETGRDVSHRFATHKAADGCAGIARVVGKPYELGVVVDDRRQRLGRNGGGAGVVIGKGIAQLGGRIGRQRHGVAHHVAATAQHVVIAAGIARDAGVRGVFERHGGQLTHAHGHGVAVLHACGRHIESGFSAVNH